MLALLDSMLIRRGMSIEALADISGVRAETISWLDRDISRVSLVAANRIVAALSAMKSLDYMEKYTVVCLWHLDAGMFNCSTTNPSLWVEWPGPRFPVAA